MRRSPRVGSEKRNRPTKARAVTSRLLALWAEMDLVLADEFRDGNVPAQMEPLPVTQRAFQSLPETVSECYFRGDSACWKRSLLTWLRDENRPAGPRRPITFAISVRMTRNWKNPMRRLPETVWKPYREDAEAESECTDLLSYWRQEEDRSEGGGPLRYVAIRIRKRQGKPFADGNEVRSFAVATNEGQWGAKKLLEWHREKAGSIEALHDVLKNELASGVDAVRKIRRQRGLGALERDDAQCADGAEACCAEGEMAASPA